MKLVVDAEVQALIPPLRPKEQQYLEASIKTYGCQDPLRVWRGVLLDGHKRYDICRRRGLPYRVEEVELPDRAAALLWVEENQLARPDLTDDQRAAVALRVHRRRTGLVGSHWTTREQQRDIVTALAEAVPPNGHSGSRAYSLEGVAQEARVSEYRIRAAVFVERGDAKLFQQVVDGATSLLQAKTELLRRKRRAERRAVAATVKRLPQGVRSGDFRRVLKDLPDNSVDLVFTDPPYDKQSVPLYGALAELASRVLVPGGSLVCYAGVHSLPDLFPLMTPHLRFWWQFCLRLKAAFPRQHGWRVHVHYKPLLWFVKGTYRGGYMVDVIESTWLAKNWHDWQQSEAEAAHCISRLTPADGLVLDPMCGSGTTLLAAARLGRRWMGADVDRDQAKVAAARLRSVARSTTKSC